jgi:hypothetical protein
VSRVCGAFGPLASSQSNNSLNAAIAVRSLPSFDFLACANPAATFDRKVSIDAETRWSSTRNLELNEKREDSSGETLRFYGGR